VTTPTSADVWPSPSSLGFSDMRGLFAFMEFAWDRSEISLTTADGGPPVTLSDEDAFSIEQDGGVEAVVHLTEESLDSPAMLCWAIGRAQQSLGENVSRALLIASNGARAAFSILGPKDLPSIYVAAHQLFTYFVKRDLLPPGKVIKFAPSQMEEEPSTNETNPGISYLLEPLVSVEVPTEMLAQISRRLEYLRDLPDRSSDLPSLVQLLGHACVLDAASSRLKTQSADVILQARALGASWAQVGAVFGISAQAAYQRWSSGGLAKHRAYQSRRRNDSEAPDTNGG
jgi:hypothetical protein